MGDTELATAASRTRTDRAGPLCGRIADFLDDFTAGASLSVTEPAGVAALEQAPGSAAGSAIHSGSRWPAP